MAESRAVAGDSSSATAARSAYNCWWVRWRIAEEGLTEEISLQAEAEFPTRSVRYLEHANSR